MKSYTMEYFDDKKRPLTPRKRQRAAELPPGYEVGEDSIVYRKRDTNTDHDVIRERLGALRELQRE